MNTDKLIEKLSSRTHSPRGPHAASDHTYRQLLQRLPAHDRPAVKPTITKRRHWSVAASVGLLVGIGVAIAGIYSVSSRLTTSPSAIEQTAPSTGPASTAQDIVFRQTPLAEIVQTLSETYRTPITLTDASLADYCITATFSSDEPLEEVLDALATVGGFSYRATDGGYELYR